MNNPPVWITFLSALLTPAITGFGAYIAYRQWKTAHNKLKMDLFDRRFSVYKATMRFFFSVMQEGKIPEDELRLFLKDTREARWLFKGKDIWEYLENDIYRKALDLQQIAAELEDTGHPERAEKFKKRTELMIWFTQQPKKLDELVAPSLKLNF